MNYKNLWTPVLILIVVLCGCIVPASATERLCDVSFENCRTQLLNLIANENVEIDAAYWFMDDANIQNALTNKIKAGVKVRMLVDPRADEAHLPNEKILQTFAAMTPPVPMRQRVTNGILHWKMMLFAGQGVVEFSGANFSPSELVAGVPYKTYTDEAIFYSDDPAIVNSFRTMYDKWWIDTVNYSDYANTSGMQLVPSYATYPIESEVCATITGGCGMDFLPSSRGADDYGNKVESAIRAEKVKLDIGMFRITNATITDTTIAAFKRGVPVRVIVDSSEYSNPARVWDRYNVDRLFAAGIPVKITKHGGENHEKSVLFYGQRVAVWGSSNWSSNSFNVQQEHNYFATYPVNPWFFDWFVNQFERRWNSAQEYRAFVPIGPAVPVYKNPANASTGIKQSTTLSWDGGLWGQRFDIYLGTGATGPLTLLASYVDTGSPDPAPNHVLGTYKISGLAPNTTYRWKIVSRTMANLTNTGPIWSFTTGGTAPTSGPTVTSVSPNTGNANGGTSVTVTGTGFVAGATVSFGVATASNIKVVNSTTITATTPPHIAGSANVAVANPAGDQGSLAGGFVYASIPPSTQPVLNVAVPNRGSPAGGDTLTISGSNLVQGIKVAIGGAPASIVSRSIVSVVVTTPPGTAGAPVDIVVTVPNGQTASLPAAFTYADPPPPPAIAAISPSSGSMNGGTQFVVSGTGFRYGAVVSFGGPPAPIGTGIPAQSMAVANDAALCGSGVPLPCIIATTPPHSAGASDVVVTNLNPATGVIDSGSGTNTMAQGYSFVVAPLISNVTPSSGSVSGGTTITIKGTNFVSGAQVSVGGQQAVVQSLTSTSITAVVPANGAGTSAVVVVNPDGQSSNTLIFTYQ
jgi:phosphatidylserine/phosphatidylglycerophosphate/cardiolipin synthase-like enzyme